MRKRNKTKVAFQGEAGAFSHAAARKLLGPGVDILPCPRFDEVFDTPRRSGQPVRGQRMSDSHIARLLGLTLDGFCTLQTIRPSPAALNELFNHTGYVDRSIRGRTAADGSRMAAHTKLAAGVPESDIKKLDLEEDFEFLMRKFKRMKSRRSQ